MTGKSGRSLSNNKNHAFMRKRGVQRRTRDSNPQPVSRRLISNQVPNHSAILHNTTMYCIDLGRLLARPTKNALQIQGFLLACRTPKRETNSLDLTEQCSRRSIQSPMCRRRAYQCNSLSYPQAATPERSCRPDRPKDRKQLTAKRTVPV